MAEKWLNHEGSYKACESTLKKYSAKEVGAQVDLFLKHYKTCQELEEKLGFMVVKARTNGVSGDGLADFKKDKGFYDAYKALDKEVDGLWKAQVQARMMSNEAKQGVSDLKILTERIDEDLKRHALSAKNQGWPAGRPFFGPGSAGSLSLPLKLPDDRAVAVEDGRVLEHILILHDLLEGQARPVRLELIQCRLCLGDLAEFGVADRQMHQKPGRGIRHLFINRDGVAVAAQHVQGVAVAGRLFKNNSLIQEEEKTAH